MAIKLSPDELDSYAAKLSKNASEAAALAKAIDASIKACTSAWEGQSQKRYVEDFEKVKPVLEKDIPEQLNNLSQNLKTIATRFRAADEV